MQMTDAEVVAACGRGDRAALRELYRRYNRAVFSWCARVLDSPDRAADATEAVFLSAWGEARRFDGELPVTSWLFDLARRATGDLAPDPDLDAVWLGGKAATQLAELPLRQAEALRLVRHERRSIEEASRILGVDEAEARRLVFDGLAALKEALEDQRATS
jgi:RNA polymerase sigma-70 factor (ECF subfamily)